MASQLPPSYIYQQGMTLMLQLIDSNLCSSKPEPIVDAETSSAQANLSHNSFDAAVLEAEIAECISTLLSEKPNEADLTNAQPEQPALVTPTNATNRAPSVHSQAGAVTNMAVTSSPPMARGIDPAVAAHLNRALSTLIAQQPSAAVPEITRLQAALREHERIPILTMEATSTQAPLKTEQPESTIKAKILTLFQPFTMSVAMKILIEGHSEPAALKLFDRRLGSALRISDEIASWNEERESKYHEFIRSGDADKYINYLNNDNESSDDSGEDENTWTPGQEEAFLQDKCHDLYNSELAAYHALSFLQGHCVPKLLATVTHYPLPATSDPLIAKHTAIHGLLLSYIPGFTLDQLPQHVPRALWQRICDDAVRAVNACSDHDILNGDVRPENCIVQCTRHPVSAESGSANRIIYRPFIIDFGMTRLRRPGESDEQWRRAKREVDEEDRMGVAMMGSLERAHGAGGYVYERSGRYQRTREEVLGDGLAGSRRANDREVVVRDGEDSPVYQRVVLVDAHEDLESEEEELGELDTEMEGTLVDADGGFKRACPLSAAEARVLGIHTADQGH